jgi:molybdate transport system substrate-binding protein
MTSMRPLVRLTLAALWAAALCAAHPAEAEPQYLTIAAANSLKDALRAILPIFEKDHGYAEVRVVWGPSQTLRDQIEQGAPVDLFLPSSLDEIDQLEKKGLILQGTKQVYAETALVLITQSAAPVRITSLADLTTGEVHRIAVGDPKTSSVGKFAAQALNSAALDERLKPRYVYGAHSGAVLDLVASGEAEVGLVYRTDAIRHKKVNIIAEVASQHHKPIVYGVATAWTSKNPFLAQQFREFLLSPKVQEVLKSYGFERANSRVASR